MPVDPMYDADCREGFRRDMAAMERELAASKEALRDRFAMAALTGMLSTVSSLAFNERVELRAGEAYKYADAMLSARNQ